MPAVRTPATGRSRSLRRSPWSLVREKEHRAGDRHQGHVRGRIEGGALEVGEASIPLLGVDHPHRIARRGKLGGKVPIFGDVVEVLAAQQHRIAGSVLLEVLDQLLLVRRSRLGRPGHQWHEPEQGGHRPAADLLRRPYDAAKEPRLILTRQADAEQHHRPSEVPGQHHVQGHRRTVGEAHDHLAPVLVASSPARRDKARMDTSSDTGAPAMPGSVVATKRTPESPGSAITRLNERAALAPPGRSRTDRSASGGPAVRSSHDPLMDTSQPAVSAHRRYGAALPAGKVGSPRRRPPACPDVRRRRPRRPRRSRSAARLERRHVVDIHGGG